MSAPQPPSQDAALTLRRDRGTSAPVPARRVRARRPAVRLTPYVLLLPGLAVIAGLLLYPVFQLLVMSTQKVGLRQIRGAPAERVGADNYRKVLESDVFWSALRNTLLFAAVTVALTLVAGTLVGLLIHRLGRIASTVVMTSTMLAWATPQVNVAVLFRWMFDEDSGVVNWGLNLLPDWFTGPVLGRADWTGHTWFLHTGSIYFVLVACVVWQSFPFIGVSVLAGLKSIPQELHEAARVDGAGPWRTFWQITMPLLRPMFAVLLVLSIIWDFKVFTQLYILLGGSGGRDAWNLSLYAYNEAFSTPPEMGLGSAIAVVLTALLLLITFVYVRQIVRQEEL